MKKAVISALLIAGGLAVSGAGAYVIFSTKPRPPASVAPAPRRVLVEVRPIERRHFTQYVRVNGTLEALRRARITADVMGEVVRIPAGIALGARLRSGQLMLKMKDVLFRIDRDKQRARIARQQASLKMERNELRRQQTLLRIAETKLKLSQTELQRRLAMVERGFVAHRTVDLARREVENARWEYAQARSNLEGSDARLQLAQAELTSARADLARTLEALRNTQVRSPFAGFISEMLVDVGDRVTQGRALFTVVDISTLKVVANVAARAMPLLRRGQEVRVALDGDPPRVFAGVLEHLGVESDSRTRTFPIEVLVPNDAEHSLLPGMFVELRITVREYPKAILIPRYAVLRGGDRRPYVYVANSAQQRARKRFISLGPKVGNQYLVGDGLQPKDLLVSSGHDLLGDGDLIKILNVNDGRPSENVPVAPVAPADHRVKREPSS